ncbi:MAG TPA: alkyl sulfatase dimerization domain-containing protein [Burkholderiaceae bacterium]|nr:alkyl sulfatase dimerization domain-containing protein [Burkholderiaceae bacterium]
MATGSARQPSGRDCDRFPAAAAASPAVAADPAPGDAHPSALQAAQDARRGFIAAPTGKVLAADGSTVWDHERYAFLREAPPATVNPSLWRHARLNGAAGLFKVVDGIHQLRGFDLANLTLIDGKTGWIVVDPLTSRETAAAAMAFARRHLGDKPVSAIIFTHSHVDHFGGAMGVVSAQEAARRQLPIVAPEGFLGEATSENILIGPAMGRRATFQFGQALPASPGGLVDAGLGKGPAMGTVGILAPTVLISRTPQEMTIDGVRFVFQSAPGTEAPAELAFYLPDARAYCGAELVAQTLHNLYTLRGAKVRDALRWSGAIDEAIQRFGDAQVMFASHHWPVWGEERVAAFLKRQRDVYRYIHDQSVRLMNAGNTPEAIAETLRLPASLASDVSVRDYYGTVRHNARAIYQHYLGWFDGNPARLDPLPRPEAARRYVALMGGADSAVAAARAALDRGEPRWAAELLDHVVFAQPDHRAARDLLARSYELLGFKAESAVWRNVYLSGAHELRSGTTASGPDPALALDLLGQAPVTRYLEAMAASLNGPRAEGSDLRINLVFSDSGETYLLWIENAVLHHRRAAPEPRANATLTMTRPVFVRLMTGSAGLQDTLLSSDLSISGSRIDLLRFLALLDKPPRSFAIVSP